MMVVFSVGNDVSDHTLLAQIFLYNIINMKYFAFFGLISTLYKHFAGTFGGRFSTGIELHDDNSCVLIRPNSNNKIAFVKYSLSTSHMIVYKVQLDYKVSANDPVIGLASSNSIDCDNVNFESNEALSVVWLIRRQKLLIGGKVAMSSMPYCSSGAIIEIVLDKGFNASFMVCNPGEKMESIKLSIPYLSTSVFPFVGAISTGSKFITFQLIESSGKDIPKQLSDISKDVYVDKIFGNMHYSRDGHRFTRTSTEQGNSCALLSRKITKGQHRWSIRIICDFGASLCVGVARYPFKLSEDYIRDPLKHIYRHPGLLLYRSYRGLLYMDGRQLEKSLQPLGWQHNSTVMLTIEVNIEKGTVEVFRNGKSIGIAFSDISGPLQPVICFYASYEKELEFVSYETTEASTDLPRQQPRVAEVYQSTPSIEIPQKVYFDQKLKYGSLTLSSDLTSISRDKSQSGNAYCLMNLVCSAVGVYRFSFVIETDQGASVCIGVTDVGSPAAIKKVEIGNIYLSPSFYLYRSFQGMLYIKGRELTKRFDEFWMSGTLVEMTIDIASNEAIVQYTVNGKDQGVAFAGLKPPLRPLIAIYAGMEKRVTLIHFEHTPKLSSPQPMTTSVYNDVNTSVTYASRISLPTVATPRDAEQPSSYECMVCGRPADTILLPCQHSMLCSEDSLRTSHCIICNQAVSGIWNILSTKS